MPTEPEAGRTEHDAADAAGWRSPALTGLFVIAAVHAMYVGRSFFVPLVLAVLLAFVLAPAVRALAKLRVPTSLGAALVLGMGGVVVGAAVYQLSAPAAGWVDQMPRTLSRFERRIAVLTDSVESVREATDTVERMATLGDDEEPLQQVEVAGSGLGDSLFDLTVGFLAQFLFVGVLLYALLASGHVFVDKLVDMAPALGNRRQLSVIARRTEKRISRYLFTITTINACLGIAAAAAMWLLGMPNPFLWGIVAGIFNFVPIVGSMVTGTVLLLVAATEFTETARIVMPPLVFLALTGIEAYFVTPAILAQRLTLNLVAVFLSLFFWGWLWGPAGALLAVPMLAAVKIVSEQVEPLAPVARLLD